MRSLIIAAILVSAALAALLLGGPEAPADARLMLLLQRGEWVPAARIATRLGDWWVVLALGGVAAAWLAWRGRPRRALALVALLLAERLAVEELKLVLDRARPDPQGHLIAVHTLAFPSGHAANAMALGLGLALMLPLSARGRTAALVAALVYAFVIGMTRLVLGVHWPSDIVGGWAVGALLALLFVRLAEGTSGAPRH
jgi:membrane-associated phospholipid phosphatase